VSRPFTNTRNTQIEALERSFPLRVLGYRLRRGTGGVGAPDENWLLPEGDESRAEQLPDKCTVHLRPGDVLRMLTPGGGAWGPPPPDP
jgi:N-methylhydantoinase B